MQLVAAHRLSYDERTLERSARGAVPSQLQDAGRMGGHHEDLLTEVLGAGHDVKIVGLPRGR